MNRETLIAIFLGFAGGILVAFLLITVPKRFTKTEKTTPPVTQTEVTETVDNLTIEKPENNSTIEGTEVEITGKTTPNTQIVLTGPSDDLVLNSDAFGNFSTKAAVYEGENLFNITAYISNEEIINKSITVFATKETL